MKEKIFLFDLDGTIVNSKKGIFNAIKYSLQKMNLEMLSENVLNKFLGPPLLESFEKYCKINSEKSELAIKYFREYYSENGVFEVEPYDKIDEILKKLSENCKIYVATSKYELYAKEILKNLDFLKYFKMVVGSNADGSFVKKDEIIKFILENEKLDNENFEIFMVGDREHDIIGANKNNIKSIAVLYGFGNKQEFEEAGATFIIEKTEDILKFI